MSETGTDATSIVEVNLNGRWIPALLPIWPNPDHVEGSEEPHEKRFIHHPIIPRDYALFSLFADVRNKSGRGFQRPMKEYIEELDYEVEFIYDTDDGGHDTLIPIDNPRGVPEDASEPWKELQNQGDFHDATHLSLKELMEAPWDQTIYEEGYVSEEEYLAYRDHGTLPKHVAMGTGGPGVKVVNEVDYAAGVRGERGTAIHLRFKSTTVRERCNWFQDILKVMLILAPDDDQSLVRLMLTFDS